MAAASTSAQKAELIRSYLQGNYSTFVLSPDSPFFFFFLILCAYDAIWEEKGLLNCGGWINEDQ